MSAPALNVHSVEPLCAGPETDQLVGDFITPEPIHFVRNHGSMPTVDPASFRLAVRGLVRDELELSLGELAQFPMINVTATLQCAGNRRLELHRIRNYTDEVLWGGDAIGNASWGGYSLLHVLRRAGVAPEATHVWFDGLDAAQVEEGQTNFGSSIPLRRAKAGNVVLATTMNGKPLTTQHGAPLRAVVPGMIGARSVKWLRAVTVSDAPSPNYFQQCAYRLPMAGLEEDPGPIEGMQLNSFICTPASARIVDGPSVTVEGYATASDCNQVVAVQLQLDGGAWVDAQLLDPPRSCTWVRWSARLSIELGTHELRVRTCDSAGHVQPLDMTVFWNDRGYMNGASQTVTVARTA